MYALMSVGIYIGIKGRHTSIHYKKLKQDIRGSRWLDMNATHIFYMSPSQTLHY